MLLDYLSEEIFIFSDEAFPHGSYFHLGVFQFRVDERYHPEADIGGCQNHKRALIVDESVPEIPKHWLKPAEPEPMVFFEGLDWDVSTGPHELTILVHPLIGVISPLWVGRTDAERVEIEV